MTRTWLVVAACALALGCKDKGKGKGNEPSANKPVAANPTADAAPKPAPKAVADAAPPAPKLEGVNFLAQARTLSRIGACHGDAAVPETLAGFDMKAHCAKLDEALKEWRTKWLDKAAPFFKEHVPAGLPSVVVYPFGGADLISALSVFPALTELTTLGLEPAGDPRAVQRLSAKHAPSELGKIGRFVRKLLLVNHSRTIDMMNVMEFGRLPAHVIFSLVALRVHGFEPVSLRYFHINRDGSLKYLTDEMVAAKEKAWKGRKGKKLRRARQLFFRNMELRFVKKGEPHSRARVYRHIAGDLENKAIRKDPGTLKHLESKGKITAMTKAASYLLWWNTFSKMRNYLLAHMEWMISDGTGIPPKFARKAGFEQITWGTFRRHIRAFEQNPGPDTIKAFRKLWKSTPYRPLPFRFGYPADDKDPNHLMITRKRSRK